MFCKKGASTVLAKNKGKMATLPEKSRHPGPAGRGGIRPTGWKNAAVTDRIWGRENQRPLPGDGSGLRPGAMPLPFLQNTNFDR